MADAALVRPPIRLNCVLPSNPLHPCFQKAFQYQGLTFNNGITLWMCLVAEAVMGWSWEAGEGVAVMECFASLLPGPAFDKAVTFPLLWTALFSLDNTSALLRSILIRVEKLKLWGELVGTAELSDQCDLGALDSADQILVFWEPPPTALNAVASQQERYLSVGLPSFTEFQDTIKRHFNSSLCPGNAVGIFPGLNVVGNCLRFARETYRGADLANAISWENLSLGGQNVEKMLKICSSDPTSLSLEQRRLGRPETHADLIRMAAENGFRVESKGLKVTPREEISCDLGELGHSLRHEDVAKWEETDEKPRPRSPNRRRFRFARAADWTAFKELESGHRGPPAIHLNNGGYLLGLREDGRFPAAIAASMLGIGMARCYGCGRKMPVKDLNTTDPTGSGEEDEGAELPPSVGHPEKLALLWRIPAETEGGEEEEPIRIAMLATLSHEHPLAQVAADVLHDELIQEAPGETALPSPSEEKAHSLLDPPPKGPLYRSVFIECQTNLALGDIAHKYWPWSKPSPTMPSLLELGGFFQDGEGSGGKAGAEAEGAGEGGCPRKAARRTRLQKKLERKRAAGQPDPALSSKDKGKRGATSRGRATASTSQGRTPKPGTTEDPALLDYSAAVVKESSATFRFKTKSVPADSTSRVCYCPTCPRGFW